MADKKISALTAATTPLAGSEVLPIVQSGSTVKVAVSNLTAGRDVNLSGLTATGATQKLGAVTMTDVTVQIGPDTPITTSSGRILFNTSSTQKNWFINHNWNLAGGLSLAQSTAAGGSTMGVDLHQWDSSGNYKIVNGNLVVGTAGKGIDFSANGGDVLSQYDEGTWVPTDASGAGLSLTVSSATYTRIGRQVTAQFDITFPTTADTNAQLLGGLPFAPAAINFGGFISYTTHGVALNLLVQNIAGNGVVSFRQAAGGSNNSNAAYSGNVIRGVLVYFV